MDTLSIKVIVGSTRPKRFSDQPATWIYEKARQRKELDVELIDLRDYPMPFFEEPMPPGMVPEGYPHDVVTRWREKVKEGDGFIFVTPEYNHGYSAVLKNALDYVYYDWSKKTVAFVSWGGAGGVRAVEQLRLVAVELDMAPTRNAVHIPNFWAMLDANGKLNFESFEQSGTTLLDQLTWWARTLKAGRAVENLGPR